MELDPKQHTKAYNSTKARPLPRTQLAHTEQGMRNPRSEAQTLRLEGVSSLGRLPAQASRNQHSSQNLKKDLQSPIPVFKMCKVEPKIKQHMKIQESTNLLRSASTRPRHRDVSISPSEINRCSRGWCGNTGFAFPVDQDEC